MEMAAGDFNHSDQTPLYLGLDLSTQQLKAVVIDGELTVHYVAKFDFDADSVGFTIHKGVIVDEALHEVYAPVALWLQAADGVLKRLKDQGLDFSRIRAISGAGQQHGSVYWTSEGEHALQTLHSSKSIQAQLAQAFSHPYSPNWQDSSTQEECDSFEQAVSGGADQLASLSGSKAHHRFTGPQILRFKKRNPEAYERTSRISLVSSFLASIFLGRVAPIDISDVCGMNLWDIKAGRFDSTLLDIASNSDSSDGLEAKLGPVFQDGGKHLGSVSKYFVDRWAFSRDCLVTVFTGDNPSTILAVPLRPLDAIISLGTSTTFLMSTPVFTPDPAVHFFNHPTTSGLYMFMLCYKNGALAREQIRDAINESARDSLPVRDDPWSRFNQQALLAPPLNQNDLSSDMQLGLYFPKPEIVPNVRAGTWRYKYDSVHGTLSSLTSATPESDARCILESQFLSIRSRSQSMLGDATSSPIAASQFHLHRPRRIYLVGGGSQNAAITQVAADVLGPSEGVWRLATSDNACALGAAYKAVWAVEREASQTFEDVIGERWSRKALATRLDCAANEGTFERYGAALAGFRRMEAEVILLQQSQ